MRSSEINKIFRDTAYVRTGGSAEELRAAEYIRDVLASHGLTAKTEDFEVDMADVKSATLTVDGKSITCKGYLNAGSGDVTAPLYYLTENDALSLSGCKGCIVIFDGYLGYWRYKDLLENGAVGFITYDGHVNYQDKDIDRRELRSFVSEGVKIPGVNINVKDAIAIVSSGAKEARITLQQDEYKGNSRNVILEIPGEAEEYITLTAHYDSTSLSKGAYDNMSGSIGLISMAIHFAKAPHRYGLRFIWCGSEERGLLGSKSYCSEHEDEIKKTVLNVNLDMIGCIMGKFVSCCTCENKLVDYISYMGNELGMQVKAYQDVYSSDSTPFADKGVPAVSFARIAPPSTATIHNSYDTLKLMSTDNMQKDIAFITAFVSRMANAVLCPVSRTIPDNVKEKIDEYLCRKRKKA